MPDLPQNARLDVVVVGRSNVDIAIHVPEIPTRGRTVFSSSLTTTPGGKAFNQAVAINRLGGKSALVSNVGEDSWGRLLASTLADTGVDGTAFHLLPNAQTGAALIEITPDGENYMVVAVSPTTELTGDDVRNARAALRAPVTVMQLDLPPEPVSALLEGRQNGILVGNLVPHPSLDRPRVLAALDVFVANEHEAAEVLEGQSVDPLHAADRLRGLGPSAVVVTAGERGAAFSSEEGRGMAPAAKVDVVDTTGAGDAFLAALALGISRQASIPEAVARAIEAGTAAVRHHGAQLHTP